MAEIPRPLRGYHDRRILIPAKHGILPTFRHTILHVRPSLQELLMQHHSSELTGDSAVDVFDDMKIRGEEDVEVALLNLEDNHIRKANSVIDRFEKLAYGVLTGTTRRWYLVCTTGAWTPLTASGRAWKSLASI